MGLQDLNQHIVLDNLGRYSFWWIAKCEAIPCVPRVQNSACNYYFYAKLGNSEFAAADLLK